MPQEPEVPVWEAIERWTPKEIWQRYREIFKEEIPLIIPGSPDSLNMEARRLRGEIERILTAKLRRGELIASGLASPLQLTNPRLDILPELWSRLRLNIQGQEASGDGLTVVELRFREPGPASTERSPATLRERQPRERRSAGRPSLMKEIEAEMRRRAGTGRLETSLRREAAALAEWAKHEIDDIHVPNSKTIERQLGRVYRELKAIKRPDK